MALNIASYAVHSFYRAGYPRYTLGSIVCGAVAYVTLLFLYPFQMKQREVAPRFYPVVPAVNPNPPYPYPYAQSNPPPYPPQYQQQGYPQHPRTAAP